MKNHVLLFNFMLLFSISLLASDTVAPLSSAEIKNSIAAGKKSTLIFFQNPMGAPCRAQKEILSKLSSDLKGSFSIANVSTTNPDDQKAFYDYGVRSLPSLVLVNKDGKIEKTFPPGIQSYESLSAILTSKQEKNK